MVCLKLLNEFNTYLDESGERPKIIKQAINIIGNGLVTITSQEEEPVAEEEPNAEEEPVAEEEIIVKAVSSENIVQDINEAIYQVLKKYEYLRTGKALYKAVITFTVPFLFES